MGKISNVTNNTDPDSVRARVFVGNLNTTSLTKDDVRAIFERYGDVVAVSVHRGYAFVQYATDSSARNAVSGEDQRVYAGQEIDVNLSAEPKAVRPTHRRRFLSTVTGAEWPPLILPPTLSPSSIAAMTAASLLSLKHRAVAAAGLTVTSRLSRRDGGNCGGQRQALVAERRRNRRRRSCATSGTGNSIETVGPKTNSGSIENSNRIDSDNGSSTSVVTSGSESDVNGWRSVTPSDDPHGIDLTDDVIICGRCKLRFTTASQLVEHRQQQVSCRLRYAACRCQNEVGGRHRNNSTESDELLSYVCATCRMPFDSCWLLCRHCQMDHGLPIYADPSVIIRNSSGLSITTVVASAMATTEEVESSDSR